MKNIEKNWLLSRVTRQIHAKVPGENQDIDDIEEVQISSEPLVQIGSKGEVRMTQK